MKKLILIFGLSGTLGICLFYFQAKKIEFAKAKNNQQSNLKIIKNKLDEFVITSNLLSSFIQKSIDEQSFSKAQLEQNLEKYLTSAPSDIIYGVGIWYEPYQFLKNVELHGPYVHRGAASNTNLILTYEWNTKEYYYPKQNWYTQGFQNTSTSYFSAPYFDNGLVYVTNSRSFVRDNKKVGVISVDLVLPLLQKIISEESFSNQNYLYITNRQGQLLAHPYKDDFLKNKHLIDGINGLSLLSFKARDFQSIYQKNPEKWIESEIIQEHLGWKIKAVTSDEIVYDELKNVKVFSIVSILGLWSILLYLWYSSRKNKKIIEDNKIQLIHSSKMASLGVMASGVAHEINNPLTVIKGKVKQIQRILAKSDIKEESITEDLSKINETVERITQIIIGLRSFSRAADNDDFIPETLKSIIENTCGLCSEKFLNSEIDLIISTIPDVKINCRHSQMSQVFLNLLSNSFDAIEGQNVKWVRFDFELQQADKIKIIISDSGEGISPHIADKMMDPFFTTKPIGKGTGLGLSISKGIIEAHGGELQYDGSEAHTKFIISLPIL